MGRAIGWGLGLLMAAGLAWTLLGDGEVGSSAPSFVVSSDTEIDGEETGPGLKVRDGARILEDENESGDAAIRGIVLDRRGLPLAGVSVKATPASTYKPDEPLRQYFKPPVPPGKPRATAMSDANGLFVLEGLVAEKSYQVEAKVAPPRYGSRRRTSATNRTRNLIKLVVDDGSALKGRVVDAAGAGLSAWVWASSSGREGLPRWLYRYWSIPALKTSSDGRFSLPAVPHGTVVFTVNVLGRGQRSNIKVDTPATEEVEIRFEDAAGASVAGRITDTTGAPVGGAKIAISARYTRGAGRGERNTSVAETDANGDYTVERLIPGEILSLSVYADGYIPPSNLGRNRPLKEGGTVRIDLVLSKGATIAGRVIDEAGAPIAGARVALGRRHGPWNPGLSVSRSTTSAEDGSYELTAVPLGAGLVTASAAGYFMAPDDGAAGRPPWMRQQPGQDYEATEEGQRIEADLTLKPGTPVVGIVTGQDGEPVAAARVELRPQNNNQYPGFPGKNGRFTVFSGAEGRFELPGLAPKSFQVRAATETHVSEWVKFAVPRAEKDGDLTVVVKEGATVAGTATTTDGTAVAGMTVTVTDALGNTVTAADGTFELSGIPAGKKTVRGSVTPRPQTAEKKVTTEWGKRVDSVDLVIPPVFSIAGVVHDEEGKPVAGVTVSARSTEKKKRRNRSTATSKKDGAFTIENLEEGDYTVYAGPTKHDRSITAPSEGNTLSFVEPTPRRVEGTVEDTAGNPVAAGRIRIYYGKDGKRRSSNTANISAGYFRSSRDIKYDAVDLEVQSAFDAAGRALNFLPERVKNVQLDGDAPIALKLTVGNELSGRVEDANGAPIAGVTVRADKKGSNRHYWPGHRSAHSARTREDGTWRIVGLKDEEMKITASPSGSWVTPEPVHARPGDTDIVFRLTQGGRMAGRVQTLEGEPIAGAQIWLHETDASRKSRGVDKQQRNHMAQYRFQRVVGADGTFEVTGLPENALYNVTASVHGKERAFVSETLRDVATGTSDMLLQLREGVMITGTLEGPEGETVGGGWIQAQPVTKGSGLKGANGHPNHQTGEFKVGPLQPGRYKLTFHVHNNNWSPPAPMEIDAPAEGLKVVMRRATKIQGVVSAPDVKGFRVVFATKGRSRSATVKADGSFSISGAGGMGKLFAHKAGDSRYGLIEDVDASSGASFTITLQEGMSISGRIQGLPENVKGGQVWAMKDGYWLQGSFKESGDFELTGLPAGEYQVSGWISGGRVVSPGKVQAGATGVVLTYKPRN